MTELPFFATKVKIGRTGVEEIFPLGPLNDYERWAWFRYLRVWMGVNAINRRFSQTISFFSSLHPTCVYVIFQSFMYLPGWCSDGDFLCISSIYLCQSTVYNRWNKKYSQSSLTTLVKSSVRWERNKVHIYDNFAYKLANFFAGKDWRNWSQSCMIAFKKESNLYTHHQQRLEQLDERHLY